MRTTTSHKGLETRDRFAAEPLLSFTLAPHAPYTVSDKTFGKILTYAEQLDLPIHIHLQETQDEIQQGLEQHQLRPLQRLQNLGLLGPNLIAVHAVHLKPDEMAVLAQQGCHVAHCPTSNLKLASGIAPVTAMLEHGINVGIGSDSAASNNRIDLFQEMRLAALLAKGTSGTGGRPAGISGAAHGHAQRGTGAGPGRADRIARAGQGSGHCRRQTWRAGNLAML